MHFLVTEQGGRLLTGDTPYGKFRIEFDHDGQLIACDMQLRHPKPMQPCRHQGPQIDTIQCPSCRGSVKLKVYACRLHDRCTGMSKLPDVRGCDTCPDRQPPPSAHA